MAKRLGRTFARFVGVVFALLGTWVFAANLIERPYSGSILAMILVAGLAGGVGGIVYLLSFDGPDRFRTRGTRLGAWIGMLVLALLPSSVSYLLLVLVVLAALTLLQQPDRDSSQASPAA